MGANIVKLGDVAIISAGQSAPKVQYFGKDGKPFVRAGSLEFLERGESIDLCEKISEENAKICKLKLYPKDSILFAKSGMSANKGRIYKLERDAYIVSHLAIITPDNTKLLPEYLMYWLQKHPPKMLIKDESYPSIGLTDIANMEIELPPLEEQKKIARILDKADEIRSKKRLANDKLDELLKSTFISMFGDPIKNNKNWSRHKMETLMTIKRGGSPRPIEKFLGGEYHWIKIGDATKNSSIYIYNTKEKIIKEGLNKTTFLPKGSLIFANCGVSLGFARILKIDGCIHDGWLSFSDIDETLNKIFLLKTLNHITEYFRKIAPDGTQPNLNTSIMKNFEVIVPPIEEQNKFAQIVEKVEVQKQKNEQVIEQMDNLFNSLSQNAFKGLL